MRAPRGKKQITKRRVEIANGPDPGACMSDWSPKSLWDRMRRTVAGWMDGATEVDEADLLSHLMFVAPLFITFVLLARR
jgi:hypothetical protein